MKKFAWLKVVRNKEIIFSVALFLTLSIIAGCHGGSGESVTGVAAAGSPITGNAYLKDSANQVLGPVPIGADGSFSFDVTGFTPPFYLLADGQVGSTRYLLYSVTTFSSGIANINPLTNAVVAAAAGGIDPAGVYENPNAHPITKENLDKAITDLQTMLRPLLAEHDAENIDPISGSFTANHTKLDKVLDLITITVNRSGNNMLVVITDITGDVIAEASTGDLKNPTKSLDPVHIPKDVLSIGADRLVATQNSDGGWEWENPDANPATGTPSPYNTLGVTAQGLLVASKISKNSAYLNACLETYNQLLSNSTNSNTSIRRIRGTDIAFLVELSEITGNPIYAAFAKGRYLAALSDFGAGTATGLAEFIRDGRKPSWLALISWDINLYIKGTLALNRYYKGQGFDVNAADMAEVIYDSLYGATADFNLSDTAQKEYWLAYTGAIEAFTTTGLHLDKRDSLQSALIASQQTAGNFVGVAGGSDVQTTAYAVMALLKAGGNDAKDAAKKGMKYLAANQSVNGGWIEATVENTEVSSEAIQAIYDFKTPSSRSVVTYVRPGSLNNITTTGLGYDQDMDPPVGGSTAYAPAPGFGKSSLFSDVTGMAPRKYTALRISPKLMLKADVLLSEIKSISFWTKQVITGPTIRTWQLRVYTATTGSDWYKTRLNTELYYPTDTDWQLNSTDGTPQHLLKFYKIKLFGLPDTFPVPPMTLAEVSATYGSESILFMDIAAGDNSGSGPISAYLDGVTIKTTKGNIVLDLTD